jgi:DNA-binding NarL/FixJ family response regulator
MMLCRLKSATNILPLPAPRPWPSFYLTERQKQIAKLLASGFCKKEVAELLGLSLKTVQKTADICYKRFGVHDQVRFTHLLLAMRWIPNVFETT